MIGALIAKKMGSKGFEALNQGNLAEFMEKWAENSIFIYPGDLKVSGTFEGKKEIEKWFKHMMKYKYEILYIFFKGGKRI